MTYDVFLLILKCYTDSSSLVHSPLAVLPGAASTILSIHITIFITNMINMVVVVISEIL